MRIRHIAMRFALLLAAAAVVPLLAYGVISLLSLQQGTAQTVVQGNLNVATRAAEEIRRYITTNAELLKAVAADLQDTGLTLAQQDRILKNYVLQLGEFREITFFDESGATIATSRVGKPRVSIPTGASVTISGVSMSPMHVDEDLLPTTLFAVHLKRLNQPAGWLVGEFSLEEMWRMVDRIRIGEHGYAMVIAPNGELVAHGDPDKKALVAQTTNLGAHPLVQAAQRATNNAPVSLEYRDADQREDLGVAARIPELGWTVIVEQPTEEAYQTATRLRRQLFGSISVALCLMVVAGYFFGRTFIRPILTLKRGTQEVAAGHLDARVDIRTGDEFTELGDAFNTMADRLVELQEDVKRQERQAMFGRVASGLVHDLLHPIQNVGNNTRLLLREDLDAQGRTDCGRIIDREMTTIKRFLEDLRNVAKPRPVERFPMDLNTSVAEIVESMRHEAEQQSITVEAHFADEPMTISGDRFALGRVYRNLITNAIQAMQPGGRVDISTSRAGNLAEVAISDTGSGIPPERLSKIFDDFVTTKRSGLGLGLAVSKRIIEQLDGTITVASEVNRGTTFTLRFPIAAAIAAAAS